MSRPKLYLVAESADSYSDEPTPKFSEHRYNIPASNELGQSWPISASVMLDENRMMEELVASKAVSHWRTKADFIRWAIHEGLKQIRQELPYLSKEMGRVESLVEYLNHEERRAQFVKMLDKVERSVQSWLDLDAVDEARRLVSNIGERVRTEFGNPEDEWIRLEVSKRLKKYEGLFVD